MTAVKESSPMRVLMVTVRSDHGGGPRHIEMLLEGLGTRVKRYIACPDDQPYRARFERLVDGPVFTLPHRRFLFGAAHGLARFVRRERIGLIHAHGKGAGLYARLASALTGVPCVHTPHGVHVGEYGALKRAAYLAYENLSSRWIKAVIYVSGDEKEVAVRMGLWQRLRSWVVPNGVRDRDNSASAARKAAMRSVLGLRSDVFVVGSVSRFDFQKNMDEAYAIARSMPETVFVWLGDGPDHGRLRARAVAEGANNIVLLGTREGSDELMDAADAYLSTSRWEGLPLAVLEAMAAGLPVVLSNVPGHREIVEGHGVGLSYPLGDVCKATELLAGLRDDPILRETLGRRARQVQRAVFSASRMSDEVLTVYRSVLQEPYR